MIKIVSRSAVFVSALLLTATFVQPAAAGMASEFRKGFRVQQADKVEPGAPKSSVFELSTRSDRTKTEDVFRSKTFYARRLSADSFRRDPSQTRDFR